LHEPNKINSKNKNKLSIIIPNKINSKNKNKLSIIIPSKIIAKISISQAKHYNK